MTRAFRISVSFPFSPARMWASGAPDEIRLDDQVQDYAGADVAGVIASLKRVVVGEAVITVY